MMQQLNSQNLSPVNGCLHGRGLGNRNLSRDERISLAANLATGVTQLQPSLAQACSILGVSTSSVRREIKDRIAGNGLSKRAAHFVEAWLSLSEGERDEVVRAIGPAEVWDSLARVVA